MHPTSMATMKKFVEDYKLRDDHVVLDIGSHDYNGSYKELFKDGSSLYLGIDITPGPNVDIILGSKVWDWLNPVDAIISGQVLEHVEDVPALFAQLKEKLKLGGLLCIIAPSAGPPHDFPHWYRNYSIESMTGFVKDAGFEVLSCTIDPSCQWCDCCCIASKPG